MIRTSQTHPTLALYAAFRTVTRYALLQACYSLCNSRKSLKIKGVYMYFYRMLQRNIYMFTRIRTHTHIHTHA